MAAWGQQGVNRATKQEQAKQAWAHLQGEASPPTQASDTETNETAQSHTSDTYWVGNGLHVPALESSTGRTLCMLRYPPARLPQAQMPRRQPLHRRVQPSSRSECLLAWLVRKFNVSIFGSYLGLELSAGATAPPTSWTCMSV